MRQKLKLTILVLVSTLVYLGLTIFGIGGPAAFFSHPPLIVLTGIFLALTLAALFTKGNLSTGVREDRANRWVISAFGALGLALAYLPALADRKDFSTIDGEGLRWLGVFLFAVGGFGRCLFSARGSAAWSRSNQGIGWSRREFIRLSVTQAISVSSSIHWAGRSPSAPASAFY